MLKSSERDSLESCWNKAKENELIFVLLGRDKAAADTVEFWCNQRILIGKNKEEDEQIQEARVWVAAVRSGAFDGL